MSDRPDILIFPPLASVLAPVLALALQWVMPLHLVPDWFSLRGFLLGLAVLLVSLGLALSGSRAFGKAGTNVNPRKPSLKIVRTGPFRITRNPMYLGMILLQVGLAFTFSIDWALVIAPVLWAVLHFGVVLREEAYLEAKFGDEYRMLLQQTRRWL